MLLARDIDHSQDSPLVHQTCARLGGRPWGYTVYVQTQIPIPL